MFSSSMPRVQASVLPPYVHGAGAADPFAAGAAEVSVRVDLRLIQMSPSRIIGPQSPRSTK